MRWHCCNGVVDIVPISPDFLLEQVKGGLPLKMRERQKMPLSMLLSLEQGLEPQVPSRRGMTSCWLSNRCLIPPFLRVMGLKVLSSCATAEGQGFLDLFRQKHRKVIWAHNPSVTIFLDVSRCRWQPASPVLLDVLLHNVLDQGTELRCVYCILLLGE